MKKKGWHCPYCPQICPRHWNMKVHIQRKHRRIGEPVEAPYNSVFIQNMNSIENKSGNFEHNMFFPPVGQTKRQESDRRDRLYGNRHFLAEESKCLRDILEIKNLANRLQDNRQRISTNDMFIAQLILLQFNRKISVYLKPLQIARINLLDFVSMFVTNAYEVYSCQSGLTIFLE